MILPAALAWVAGSILLPHNDDFGYRRVVQTLYQTGRLELVGWSNMTLIGQVFFALPFMWLLQGSPWAFAASTLILTAIGVIAGYDLARRVVSLAATTRSSRPAELLRRPQDEREGRDRAEGVGHTRRPQHLNRGG